MHVLRHRLQRQSYHRGASKRDDLTNPVHALTAMQLQWTLTEAAYEVQCRIIVFAGMDCVENADLVESTAMRTCLSLFPNEDSA